MSFDYLLYKNCENGDHNRRFFKVTGDRVLKTGIVGTHVYSTCKRAWVRGYTNNSLTLRASMAFLHVYTAFALRVPGTMLDAGTKGTTAL